MRINSPPIYNTINIQRMTLRFSLRVLI